MVAGEDKNIIGIVPVDILNILKYCVCGTLVPCGTALALIRRQNHNSAVHAVKVPRLAVADVFIKHKRLILRKHSDGVYTGVYAV